MHPIVTHRMMVNVAAVLCAIALLGIGAAAAHPGHEAPAGGHVHMPGGAVLPAGSFVAVLLAVAVTAIAVGLIVQGRRRRSSR